MPYDVKRFIFSVSLCAMLVANPVLATAPTNDEDLGTTHDVYVESTLNQATNGIAGVSYVNRMVNAAGNAADAAEAHAAAAGAHALSAAQSADEAHKVLADKVNIEQGADNKNLAMVTDEDGSVYAGYISTDMIEKTDPTCYVNASGVRICSYENQVLISDDDGNVKWGQVANAIADGAVTLDKISSIYHGYAVTGFLYGNGSGNGDVEVFAVHGDVGPALIGWEEGAPIAVAASDSGGVLKVYGSGVDKGIGFAHITTEDIGSGAVMTDNIASGAVTRDKITAAAWSNSSGYVLDAAVGSVLTVSNEDGSVSWEKVKTAGIADGAVTSDKLDLRRHIVEAGMPLVVEWKNNTTGMTYGAGTILPSGIVSADENGMALVSQKHVDSSGRASYVTEWGQVSSVGIANGAVTIDKTAGVVGMVPVGGEGATTYGSFWIE